MGGTEANVKITGFLFMQFLFRGNVLYTIYIMWWIIGCPGSTGKPTRYSLIAGERAVSGIAHRHTLGCPESHAVLLRTFAEPPEYILSQLKKAGVGVAPESFIYYS